jgi:glycosyltransferase involved in cell wall biosynthesis
VLKIIQICSRPKGSVTDMALAAAGGFAKAGHVVTNLFLSGPIDNPLAKRFASRCVNDADALAQPGRRAAVRQLRRMLRQEAGDVVIAHRYHPCKLAAQAARGISLKRKVVVFHGIGNLRRWRRKLFAGLFLRDWRFAGVSRAVVEDIRASGAVCLNRRGAHQVSNGLDIKATAAAQLDRKDARQRLGLPPDGFIFGHVGRLSDQKNQKVLIAAYADIVARMPSSRLVFIGKGSREAELRSLVATHGLCDHVLFKGFVPHAQRYLKAFDIFLFPSRSEAFGLALLEAMIARVPVIVSHVEGIRELVGPYPFTIQPDDVQTWASQMAAMATKPAGERDQIAGGLYARAAKRYDISRLEEAYLKVIAGVS